APLEARQDVHQIHMPPMKPAQVIAESEAMIGVARFPVTRGGYAMQETSIVQHRQVEPGPVPGNQVRREFVQPVEESLDQYLLRGAVVADAPHFQGVSGAQHHGDRHHAVLLVREKFAAGFLAALGEHDLRHLLIGQVVQAVKTPAKIGVGNRLDVEHQGIHAGTRRMRTATATTRPASSVKVTWPSPMPRPSRTLAPRAEYTTSGLPQEFCTTPTSRIHTPCAKPVPIPLTMASLAAKRMAMNRAGRMIRRPPRSETWCRERV